MFHNQVIYLLVCCLQLLLQKKVCRGFRPVLAICISFNFWQLFSLSSISNVFSPTVDLANVSGGKWGIYWTDVSPLMGQLKHWVQSGFSSDVNFKCVCQFSTSTLNWNVSFVEPKSQAPLNLWWKLSNYGGIYQVKLSPFDYKMKFFIWRCFCLFSFGQKYDVISSLYLLEVFSAQACQNDEDDLDLTMVTKR